MTGKYQSEFIVLTFVREAVSRAKRRPQNAKQAVIEEERVASHDVNEWRYTNGNNKRIGIESVDRCLSDADDYDDDDDDRNIEWRLLTTSAGARSRPLSIKRPAGQSLSRGRRCLRKAVFVTASAAHRVGGT